MARLVNFLSEPVLVVRKFLRRGSRLQNTQFRLNRFVQLHVFGDAVLENPGR